jgi:1-acyl-sn-glycerol-3-phosphate acyltransferase
MNAGRGDSLQSGREVYPLPRIATRQLRWFLTYVKFFFQRNFHAVRLLRLHPLESVENRPVLVCLSHPSWWDPLLALYLSQRFFGARQNYGPIAAEGLAKYRFFEKLGFFGIDPASASGSARFVRIGQSVLSRADCAFWVTAQGHFTDVRCRPVRFQSGVGYLAHHLTEFAMLPLALEYAFWNERYPEAFACFGEPLLIGSGRERTASEWTALFSARLEETQDVLSQRVMARQAGGFETLICGSAGIGGVYDIWRALKAKLGGKQFRQEHGSY